VALGSTSWQNCAAMSGTARKLLTVLGIICWPRARVCFGSFLVFSAILSRPSAGPAGIVLWHGGDRGSVNSSAGSDEPVNSEAHAGMEIVRHGGYPEVRVDGRPFFIHSAAFFYYRIPRDLWEPMLDRYRALAIKTLDIYIPWNWHEPKEGEFDFDGHTNPRRDLRRLLVLATEKGFKLIARPGPEILNEWLHGGYPSWLLDRPEYKMDPLDWVEGRYPPLDNLNALDAESAAQGWLENTTHMERAHAWMTAVAKELAPYSSHTMVRTRSENREESPRDLSGPLLFVQLGDDFAIGRTNRVGSDFWRYVERLRGMLAGGGLDVPVFINPTDMRVSAAGSVQDPAIGVMGQWYMRARDPASADAEAPSLTARDAGEIEFFAEELKTQPDFPPVMIEYQAGWYAPADDDRPLPNSPENTLLSSRLLIGNGVHGINYFPLQDTFTPAGYSVPWANRSYRWDAALSPDGEPQPRSGPVRRNAQFLEAWGPLLAASHKRPDFGIIYPLGAYPQDLLTAQDILNVSESVMRVERLGILAMLSSELVDPEFQPVEQLLRDPVLFLPCLDPEKAEFQLSERAQQAIVDYVRRGGELIVFPVRPAGKIISELWKDVPGETAPSAESPIRAKWKSGSGEVIESSKDFYSWVSLDKSFADNRADEAFHWARSVLNEFLVAAGVEPALKLSGQPRGADDLIASEIVTNEGTGQLGNRTSGQGLLSVTNLSKKATADAMIEILSPSASARGKSNAYSSLNVVVPPRESLLLPLGIPLCSADAKDNSCSDDIPVAGAEFLGVGREGKTLELNFFVPSRAEVHLHLAKKPSRAALDETDTHPDSTWFPTNHEFQLTIPRGAAPDFRRTLKLDVPYLPHLEQTKRNQAGKAPPEDLDCYIENAVRLPTSGDAFLRTFPAFVVPDPDQKTNVLLIAENRNQYASGSIDLSFDKPLHGTKNLVVPARGTASELIEFRRAEIQASGAALSADHLFHAAIEVRAGRDHRVLPVVFLLHSNDTQDHYRFDFDRDGADEWVLENDRLRLIVSPESGGRAIALVDKLSGANLSTSVGLLRDSFSFAVNRPGISEARKRGRYGLSNRSYAAEWGPDAAHPALKLRYDASDVFPAGASVEKTIRLGGADEVEVSYRITLHAKADEDKTNNSQPQSFAAVNSFPAEAANGSTARFCWQKNQQEKLSSGIEKGPGHEGEDQTCEEFVPDGKPLNIPEGVSKLEIHNAGRSGIEIGWDCDESCGRMTIEPKHFSALFRLEFPPLVAGAEATNYSMRIRALNTP
jgi:Glycosyl hydrolases family 35